MTRSEENLHDFSAVISELNRLPYWAPEVCTNTKIEIPFTNIGKRRRNSDSEKLTYDLKSYIHELKLEFRQQFIAQSKKLDQRTSDRVVDKALTKLKKKRLKRVYFIPCHFLRVNNPARFQIGDVTFLPYEEFARLYMDRIPPLKLRKNASTEKQEIQQRLNNKIVDFYSEFRWIGKVEVPECLPEISVQRAKEAVRTALDALKLFWGPRVGKRFMTAYDANARAEFAILSLDEKEDLDWTYTVGENGYPAADDWWSDLQDRYKLEIQLTGISVNHVLDPSKDTPLHSKWLGALKWYGQGVTESSDAARIVKYVAALEQLTNTRKSVNADIKRTITDRTKFLCGEILEHDESGETESAIRSLYDFRSDLMHGRISPIDDKIPDAATTSGRITQQALFQALHFFVHVTNEFKDSVEELEKQYEKFNESTGENNS